MRKTTTIRPGGLGRIVLSGLCLFLAVNELHAQSTMQARLNASDGASLDAFGRSVAIDGNTAIVGVYADDHVGAEEAGSAYIYFLSGAVWTQQFKLIASDAAAIDLFGNAVAISGDTAVVGALLDDNDGGENAGAAYVFVRSGSFWTQQAKLTASDGGPLHSFGSSVAINGDTVVVGASPHNSAYVFVRSGTTWTEQAQLTPRTPATAGYGWSVSIAGNTAVVGAISDTHAGGFGAGSAYVFVRAGTVWTEQAKLIASDAAENDQLGVSVSIAADTAIIGAHADDHAAGADAGSAYVFVRSGNVWTEQAKLTASDAAAGDFFGWSVSITDGGSRAIVGAFQNDLAPGTNVGAAYLFSRSGGTTWSQQATLTAVDGAGGDDFGYSVAISNDTAVIGAFADFVNGSQIGSTYVVAVGADSCSVDSNRDGVVNLDDLLNVINGWGICP